MVLFPLAGKLTLHAVLHELALPAPSLIWRASRGRRDFFANVKLERDNRTRHMTSDRPVCNLLRYRHIKIV